MGRVWISRGYRAGSGSPFFEFSGFERVRVFQIFAERVRVSSLILASRFGYLVMHKKLKFHKNMLHFFNFSSFADFNLKDFAILRTNDCIFKMKLKLIKKNNYVGRLPRQARPVYLNKIEINFYDEIASKTTNSHGMVDY